MSKKYLVCRPRGGLNDNLCQIQLCYEYAARFGRTLVIDGRRSNFFGEFGSYLQCDGSEVEVLGHTAVLGELFDLTCYPIPVQKWADCKNDTFHSKVSKKYLDAETGLELSFDFDLDYAEFVLFHEQCGGGDTSFKFFQNFKFCPEFRVAITDRLRSLPLVFDAVHVRNTDYQTDYEVFFSSLPRKTMGKNLLICSDDSNVVEFGRQFFSSLNIFSLMDHKNLNGQPLHGSRRFNNASEKFIAVTEAWSDLFALSLAENLYFTKTLNGPISGFSRLASYLQQNKHVIRSYLSPIYSSHYSIK